MKIKKARVKGFILTQSLWDAAVTATLIISAYFVISSCTAANRREDVKLQCLIRNITAAETIRFMYSQSGDIDDLAGYYDESGGYVTAAVSVDSARDGVYRVAVDTRYKGEFSKGTELIFYVRAG